MYTLDKIKFEIADKINRAVGQTAIEAADLAYPPNSELGDLSLPCFTAAKAAGQNPAAIAQNLVAKMSADDKISGMISTVTAAGPYLNFKLSNIYLARELFTSFEKYGDEYGINKKGRQERVLVEYSNVNTHKEYHVGHLRNICYGDTVNRILTANGYDSIPVSYINDFGIHVAKTLWAYLEYYKDQPLSGNKGELLGQIYVRASGELKENKTAKRLVELMMKKIESRKGKEYELWQETRQWSIEQFDEIYRELNVSFKHTFYESEYIDQGRELVFRLKEQGVLEESQGAIIANLDKYNLGVLVILRSDGTATYPVADIPLAEAKAKMFSPDKSIYVVDIRQALYFKQLFKILELMGHREKLVHLGFEFVKLPSGMMSSRSGNVITYKDLKGQVMAKAVAETKERHPDWGEARVDDTARALAIGAIKFEMVKVSASQGITFDINACLAFSGYTAAYLQYAYARIESIMRKSKDKESDNIEPADFGRLSENKEHNLMIKLAKFPETVVQAGENYDPSAVARYLFELAKEFNDYYHVVPVLKAEEEVKVARLWLLTSVKRVLGHGFRLLGIEPLSEM